MTRRKWGLLLSLLTASVLLPVAQGARGLAQTGGTGPAAAPAAAPAATATSAAAPPTAAPPAVAGKAADAALLLAFKDTFDNGAALLPSWQPGTDPCVWQGVACVNGAVTGIEVMNLGLTGQIPQPNGWVLPPTVVDLSIGNTAGERSNAIRGPIPPGWKLPEALNILVLNNLPIGGSLSADWRLPPNFQFMLFQNTSLTGPLPTGWALPPLQSIQLMSNQLTGSIPKEFTELGSLIFLNLENNRMSGPLPASMAFNTSWDVYGLSVQNNNFSGPVPSWPDAPKSSMAIYPGNEGLCGTVPQHPALVVARDGGGNPRDVESLPPCPGQETSSGLSGGAIAGIVVGCVAGGSLALVGAAWLARRRRRQKEPQLDSGATTGTSSGLDSGAKKVTPTASIGPNGSWQASPVLFNPFTAGPTRSGEPSGTLGGSSQGLSLAAASPLLKTMSGSGGSEGTAAQQAALASKLEALERAPPAWLISPGRLVLEQGTSGRLVLLGRGSYGRVYRGWLAPEALPPGAQGADAAAAGGVPVAIKVMDVADISSFLREAHLMQHLSGGPNMVLLHGACVVDAQLIVVMELLEGGDLQAALATDGAGRLDWRQGGRQVALDIASGLAHLHANNVTHRDLKSKNVLLTEGLRAKVADIGGAALHSATFLSLGSSNFGGTLAWAAPELLLGEPCTHKIDIYSLGVVLWELATKEIPQRGHVRPPPPSDACPQGLSNLIRECLAQRPEQRPSAAEVLQRLQEL